MAIAGERKIVVDGKEFAWKVVRFYVIIRNVLTNDQRTFDKHRDQVITPGSVANWIRVNMLGLQLVEGKVEVAVEELAQARKPVKALASQPEAYALIAVCNFLFEDFELQTEEEVVEIHLDPAVALSEVERFNNVRDEFGTNTERLDLYKEYHRDGKYAFVRNGITDIKKQEWILTCLSGQGIIIYKMRKYPLFGSVLA